MESVLHTQHTYMEGANRKKYDRYLFLLLEFNSGTHITILSKQFQLILSKTLATEP